MKADRLLRLFPLAPCLLFAAVNALVAYDGPRYPLLFEDFTSPPNALDESVWARSGAYHPVHTVAGGQLRMRSAGWAHHATITTVERPFNFLERELGFTVRLSGFPPPDWNTDPLNSSGRREVYFVLGPAANWDQYIDRNNEYYQWEGFGLVLRWQVTSMDDPRTGKLYLRTENAAIELAEQELSAVPTAITAVVDSGTFSIHLEGADFVGGGSSSFYGTHSLDDAEWDGRYYFMMVLHQSALDTTVFSEVVADSIEIFTTEAPPAATEWAGFPLDGEGWVDTGRWHGMLYVALDPWVYSQNFATWFYLPEASVSNGGAWIHAPR